MWGLCKSRSPILRNIKALGTYSIQMFTGLSLACSPRKWWSSLSPLSQFIFFFPLPVLSHLCSEFSKGSSAPFVPLYTVANLFWCLPPACSLTYHRTWKTQGLRIDFCSYENMNEHALLGCLLQSHWPDFSTYSVFCKRLHQEEFGKRTVFYWHNFSQICFHTWTLFQTCVVACLCVRLLWCLSIS